MKKKMVAVLCAALCFTMPMSGCGENKAAGSEKTSQTADTTAEAVDTTDAEATEKAAEPTAEATVEPTVEPTAEATEEPTKEPTAEAAGETDSAAASTELEDGTYTAEFKTDSGMFHVSEACDGKGTLTVADGKMTIHISLGSKNIVNLFPGLAADAAKEGAEILQPTTDSVTYSDGWKEDVFGFDVPVPALDEEFDLALIGKKGTWYDHKVSVSNPVKE